MAGDGIVQVEPGDPRYCPLAMAAERHEPHKYEYEYDRPEGLGGHTRGYYFCDGEPLWDAPLIPESPS